MGGTNVNVAGIDYSTLAIDVVLVPLDDGPPVWHRYELLGSDAFSRTRHVPIVVPGRHVSFWDDVLAVGIEHPGGNHGTRDMIRVQGAILSCIPARMLVEPWPPAKWRKTVGLPGNANKVEVEVYSHSVTYANTQRWPQDAHDAHLIALATRQAIRTEQAA